MTALVLGLPAVCLFAAAAATDLAQRRIPNRISLALAGLGLLRIALAVAAGEGGVAASVLLDVAAAGAVFALGALGFHLGLMGGGDVKLLAAGTLWLGAAAVMPFLVLTAVAGGLLAVLYLASAAFAGAAGRATQPGLPYGVAIAAGGILVSLAGL